jgi:hypothetical protein
VHRDQWRGNSIRLLKVRFFPRPPFPM